MTPPSAPTLILTGRDIARLMKPADYLEPVARGFRALADGTIESPVPLHLHGQGGGFHAKGAIQKGEKAYAVVKINGNFPANGRGLPTIQGVIVLSDGTNGRVLAVMDSAEITVRRTAAATALAVRACARPEASAVAVCGAGVQGRAQLEALRDVVRLRKVAVWDQDRARSARYAAEMSQTIDLPISVVGTVAEAADDADIVLACTSAREPYLTPANVRPGTFIAAVGADNPDKSEVAPALMRHARVVTDVTAQCQLMGDLHHALAAGAMTLGDVRAELGDVLSGRAEVRGAKDDIVVFDSTGTAAQDIASAVAVFERAKAAGIGQSVDFLER